MKYLTIILISLLSVSCMSTRRIKKNCDLFADICITETETETEIRYVDTTIYVYRDTSYNVPIPPKIIYKEKPVTIIQGLVYSKPLILETDLCKSISQVRNSKLTATLEQKDTTIRFELKNALIREEHWKSEYIKETNKETVTIQENTNWAKACIKITWGLIVVIMVGIAYLIFRFKSKLLKIFK